MHKRIDVVVVVVAVGCALALPSATLAAAVANGEYSGTSSQSGATGHYAFGLDVSGAKITRGDYTANYKGNSACVRDSGVRTIWGQGIKGGKAVTIKNGKFSANDRIYAGDYLKISGKFVGDTVSGSFDETFTSGTVVNGRVHDYTCTSGKVTFTATLS